MTQNKFRSMNVGEIVVNDLRTADIFKTAGIDFYCQGNETLEKMCTDKNLDLLAIETELDELESMETEPSQNFNKWDLDVLCDYIMNTHHKTIVKQLPKLSFYTVMIADVYGSRHPEMLKIAKQFAKITIELTHHLAKEEEVLFPAIKEILQTNSSDSKLIIVSEIMRMKTEHEFTEGVLDNIKELSNNYTIQPDASIIYLLTYKLLEQFEDNLLFHIHLENNILYPKALELAK